MSNTDVDVVVIRHTASEETPDDAEIRDLVARALDAEAATGAWEISVVLVAPSTLHAALERLLEDAGEDLCPWLERAHAGQPLGPARGR